VPKTTIFFSFITLLNFFSLLIFEKNDNLNLTKVIIRPGMNLEEISRELSLKKIVKNSDIFKIWVKLSFQEKKLKYGEFLFEKSNSIYDVTKNSWA
jgi:cell division protein YceG involved in septum cleavage